MTDAFPRAGGQLHCERVALERIAEAVATPAYVYSATALAEAYDAFDAAFSGVPHALCYSIKSNMNLAVVRLLVRRGSGVDVTSGGELFRALRAGADPARIVYSGVGKTDAEIDAALAAGVRLFNAESRAELRRIDARAAAVGRVAPVAFRVNPDVDAKTHPYISTGLRQNKFGVPWRDAVGLLRYATTLSHIDVRGVHSHIGSQIISIPVFEHAAKMLVEVVQEVRTAGIPVHDLDFGGGFGIQYHGVLVHPGLPAEHAEVRGSTVPAVLRAVLPILRSSEEGDEDVPGEEGEHRVTSWKVEG